MTAEMTIEDVERLEAEVRRLKRALADVTASTSESARAHIEAKGGDVGERLHCNHCSANFSTVWERSEHEREDHTAQQSEIAAKETEIARLREALAWYAERASSLANKDWKDNADYALAIFAELSLDGGIRARAAIGKGEGEYGADDAVKAARRLRANMEKAVDDELRKARAVDTALGKGGE